MKNDNCKECCYYAPEAAGTSLKYRCGWVPAKQKEGCLPCDFLNGYAAKIGVILIDRLSLVGTDSSVSVAEVREAVNYVKIWLRCESMVCTLEYNDYSFLLSKLDDIVLNLVATQRRFIKG